MLKNLGNDIFELDGKKYSIKQAKKDEILQTWKCPYCSHSELSYIIEESEATHFLKCKAAKKALIKKI